MTWEEARDPALDVMSWGVARFRPSAPAKWRTELGTTFETYFIGLRCDLQEWSASGGESSRSNPRRPRRYQPRRPDKPDQASVIQLQVRHFLESGINRLYLGIATLQALESLRGATNEEVRSVADRRADRTRAPTCPPAQPRALVVTVRNLCPCLRWASTLSAGGRHWPTSRAAWESLERCRDCRGSGSSLLHCRRSGLGTAWRTKPRRL